MLNDLVGFDFVYKNKNEKIVYDMTHNSQSSNKNNHYYESMHSIFEDNETKDNSTINVNEQFQTQWTSKQLTQFNKHIVDNIINHKSNKYDGLIYFISSHMKHDNKYQHYLYDSDDQL